MDTDEGEAVESLKRLGLSEYESKVFIALQRLGVGTARDIHSLTDVPRSQVYGAAESLEERGLVEVKQSKPMEYRPVSLEEAQERLGERFEREKDRAFRFLEEARDDSPEGKEEREDFWTVNGSETIDSRIKSLLGEAEERVVYIATENALVNDDTEDALRSLAEGGEVDVYVVSRDPEARERFTDSSITCVETPEKAEREDRGGRFVMVDSDTVLLTVLSDDGTGSLEETAVWSSGTSFASVIVQITEGWVAEII